MNYQQINSKVVSVKINPGTPVLARRGAMLGYDGDISFLPVHGQGTDMRSRVGAHMANETNKMMAAQGEGTIYYGHRGYYATVVELNNETLTCEADRLLVHDANLQTSVEFIGSGGAREAVRGMMTGQGLFTTKVHGSGKVVLLSHGGTFPLDVGGNAGSVSVDPQAYVGHTGAVTVNLTGKVGLRDAIGRGSGEAFQLKFTGTGKVYVQASEQKI